jgi:hypothetical protein
VSTSRSISARESDVGSSCPIVDDGDQKRLLPLDLDIGDGGGEALAISTDVARRHWGEVRDWVLGIGPISIFLLLIPNS